MGNYYDVLRISFGQLKAQTRFLDREFAKTLNPITLKFFMRAGGAIRTTARRLLKKARRKKPAELVGQERTNYETAKKLYAKGRRTTRRLLKSGRWIADAAPVKPELPDAVADKGKPPMLHVEWDAGTSPLKHRLWFALTDDKTSLLVGPAAIGKNRSNVKNGGKSSLRELERDHPFMEPAYKIIEPRLPGYLRAAAGA